MNKMNESDIDSNSSSKDLFIRTARYGNFGWVVSFILLIAIIIQTTIYNLLPPQVVGVDENGQYVGFVSFSGIQNRSKDIVISDSKNFLSRCISISKINIYEDLSLCLNHMNDELANQKVIEYEEVNIEGYKNTSYPKYIELNGCQRTNIIFKDEKTEVTIRGNEFITKLTGTQICNDGEQPLSVNFITVISGVLVPKTVDARPYGIEVTKIEDF